MSGTSPASIVFITGACISNRCWDDWKLFFETQGFDCIAPAWPHKDASSEELRNRSVDDPVHGNTIDAVSDHFAGIINAMPGRPILIGHSLGGLIAQSLLDRGLGKAAVLIHSFPPAGVNSWQFFFRRMIWEARIFLTPLKKTYLLPFKTWRYTMVRGMDFFQQKDLYYRYAVPESKLIIREAFKAAAKIDFKNPQGPLLFTSGGNDKLIPPGLNYRNYSRYTTADSLTTYVEFKEHKHLVFAVPGWKKQAVCILNWIKAIE